MLRCKCHSLVRTLQRSTLGAARSASTSGTNNRTHWPGNGWKAVIGLELHVQLRGNLKLLSPTLATYDAPPNTHVATYDAALPGSLPRLGAEPVRLALLAALALQSTVNSTSTFDRKHYFYPDLPAGFQVTQKYSPLATGGIVKVRNAKTDDEFEVRIEQIQLEQDTAKSSHDPETGLTFIDLNRAGAALIEIVTRPDMRSPTEAAAFVRKLQAILRHIGATDGNMNKGELRIDVNVSVQKDDIGSDFGTRCEIKNLNGVKFMMAAMESEARRQIVELEAGRQVEQATRGFDAITSKTFFLRGKADAPDYRYMPDPELGRIVVTPERIEELLQSLPELPDEAFDRLRRDHGLTSRDAAILVALGEGAEDDAAASLASLSDLGQDEERGAGSGVRFFDEVADMRNGKVVANWMINELLGALAKARISFAASPISTGEFGTLIDALAGGFITGTEGKAFLQQALREPFPLLSSFVHEALLKPKVDPHATPLEEVILGIVEEFPVEVKKIQSGETKVLRRLVGEAMKRTNGRADVKEINRLLDLIIHS